MNWILKFIPLLPQLITLITKLIAAFKKAPKPAEIEGKAAAEAKALAVETEKLPAKEADEWKIVKGED